MFESVVARLRAPIVNAVADITGKILVAVPLLIAAAFLVAALHVFLVQNFGPLTANLLMAGGFILVAALVAIIVAGQRSARESQSRTGGASVARDARTKLEAANKAAGRAVDEADSRVKSIVNRLSQPSQERDLALQAAKIVVPLALPAVLKIVGRNWQAIGAAAAAVFVVRKVARHVAAPQSGPAATQTAAAQASAAQAKSVSTTAGQSIAGTASQQPMPPAGAAVRQARR